MIDQKMLGKEKKSKWMYSLIGLFLLIYLFDGGYPNYSYIGYYGKIVIPLILAIALFFPQISIIHRFSAGLLGSITIIAFTSILHSSSLGITIAYCALLFASYLLTRLFKFDSFVNAYLTLMRFVAVCSLALYLVVWLFPNIRDTVIPIIEYSHNVPKPVQYYDIIITHIPVYTWKVVRNYGLAWEPGVYQIYLNLALLLSIYYSPVKKLKWDIALFGITVVTTFSTAGYMAFFLVLLNLFISNRFSWHRKWVIMSSMAVLVIIIVSVFNERLFDIVFFKLTGEGKETGSYISRFTSIWGSLRLMLSNPLLGVGHSKTKELLNQMYGVTNIHQTNTLMNAYASYGLFVGIYFTSLWGRTAKLIGKTTISALLAFMTIVILLSGENMTTSMMLNIFMFYGCNERIRRRSLCT